MPDLRSGSSTNPLDNQSANPNPIPRNGNLQNRTVSDPATDGNPNTSFQSTTSHVDANREAGSTPALDTVITAIVNQVLEAKGPSLVQSILNPNADNFAGIDQPISLEHRGNLSDLDKIPDVVRCLRDFSGDPGEFSSWKKSVDRILQIYDPIKGTPKYYGILSVIRNKIKGNADIALESYNTPLNWSSISRCLIMHYADKRDVSTLEYQMTSLVQGNHSVQDFYQTVSSHLSLILNKLTCMDVSPESMRLLTQTYRDKALDTFIRGLRGDLPRLLGIREPLDLPHALNLCLKLENQNYRTNYAYSNQGATKKYQSQTSAFPPRKHVPSTQHPATPHLPQTYRAQPNTSFAQRPAQPQFLSRQYPINNTQYPNQFRANAPNQSFSNPHVKAEPPSAQTRPPNYQNKNTNNRFAQFKPRPMSQQFTTDKIQKNFHIETEEYDHSDYHQLAQSEDTGYDQTLAEYVEQQDQSEHSIETNEILDFADINFLD